MKMVAGGNQGGISIKPLVAVVVVSFLCFFLPDQCLCQYRQAQTAQGSGDSKSGRLTVTGLIINEDGSPAVGVAIYVFPYNDGKLNWVGLKFYEDSGWGPAQNPRGKTDATGRFRIQFALDYLKDATTSEFAVGTFRGGPRALKATEPIEASVILNVGLFDATVEFDINKLFKKIVIQR
jgi:5-hydroxyisourate hydrolase-like protein (transthyretin family)